MKSRLQKAVARYAGHCIACGATIARNAQIFYDWSAKQTYCKACGEFKKQSEGSLFDQVTP